MAACAASDGGADASPPVAASFFHTVSAGETLYRIAKGYGTTVKAVQQANGLKTNTVSAGQRLAIPKTEITELFAGGDAPPDTTKPEAAAQVMPPVLVSPGSDIQEKPASSQPVSGVQADADDLAGLVALNEDDLGTMRGGFSFGGMTMSLAVDLRTTIDNVLVGQTLMTNAGQGWVVQQQALPGGVDGLTLITNGSSNGQPLAHFTPSSIDLSGLANASGLTVSNSQGFTAVLTQMTDRGIVNTVTNNANGRNVQVDGTVTINIQNFHHLQSLLGNMQLLNRITR